MKLEPAVEQAELHMVTISLKVAKMDMIRNEYIRGAAWFDQTVIRVGKAMLRNMGGGGRRPILGNRG